MFGAHSLGVLAAAGFGHFANVFEHVKSSTSVLYARCNTWDASQALVCVFEAEVDSSKIRPGPSAWKFASQNEYEREGGDQGEGENDGDGDGDRDVQGSFRNNNTSVTKEDEPFGSKVEDDSPGFGAEDDSLYSEEEHLERVAEKLKRWILEHPKEAAELLACLTSAPAAVILTPIVLGLIGFTPLGVAAGSLDAAVQSVLGPVVASSAFAILQSAAMGGYGAIIVNTIAATGATTGTCGFVATSFLRVTKDEEPKDVQTPDREHDLASCWSHCYANLVKDNSKTPGSLSSKTLCVDPAFYAHTCS